MEALIKPEFGLMFWTILIFILLVLILAKLAWKPLIHSIEEREKNLRLEREMAEKARIEAEKIKNELEGKLKSLMDEVQSKLDGAKKEGEKQRDKIIEEGKASAGSILEQAYKDMEEEKKKLMLELKAEVVHLSVMAAERILNKTIDAQFQKEIVSDFLNEIEAKGSKKNL
jgi:F-type H+-transporting ATPase subunit b